MACPLAAGALWRGAFNHLRGFPKIFSYGPCMICPSLPRLEASVVVFTTPLIAPTHSLQQLVYMCFVVATTLHLLEVLTSYYQLSCKAIS